MIEKYNKTALNDFIRNSYVIFEKQTQKDQIIQTYKRMNIKVDQLVRKKSEDEDEEESTDS